MDTSRSPPFTTTQFHETLTFSSKLFSIFIIVFVCYRPRGYIYSFTRKACLLYLTQAFYDPRVIPQSKSTWGYQLPRWRRGTVQCRTSMHSDGCSIDPDPNMDMQHAHVRNRHSNCQCSYVLQFTRHEVHRLPSQMIHCIVLYLGFPALRSGGFVSLNRFPKDPQRGEHKIRQRRTAPPTGLAQVAK